MKPQEEVHDFSHNLNILTITSNFKEMESYEKQYNLGIFLYKIYILFSSIMIYKK